MFALSSWEKLENSRLRKSLDRRCSYLVHSLNILNNLPHLFDRRLHVDNQM